MAYRSGLHRVGKAIADPTRCDILLCLLDGPHYPTELAAHLGLTKANVSNHLACLRGCGLVVATQEGRRMRYELADPRLARRARRSRRCCVERGHGVRGRRRHGLVMAIAALVLYVVWFLLAFGLRTIVQIRRTGDTGWRAGGLPGRTGSVEWWAALLFVVALLVGLAAPIAELAGLAPISALDVDLVAYTGTAVAAVGVLLSLAAQLSMGDSWRIGVDETESTDLVTEGAFRIVRNPIFSAMLVTAIGLALMVPNAIALTGVVALIVALELQVRGAEEPHLARIHGPRYLQYAGQVGRFVPTLGRLEHSQRQ